MKILQNQVYCMRTKKITNASCSGYPSMTYPNSKQYAYHDFYEAEFFLSGNGLHYINGTPYRVKPGYFYLLYPGDCHRMELDEESFYSLRNLKFTVDIPRTEIMNEIGTYQRPYCIYFDEKMTETVEAELELLENSSENPRLMTNIVERLCITVLDALKTDGKEASLSDAFDQRIELVNEYIDKNYSSKITSVDAARVVNLSENYFGIFFRERTGRHFTEYVNQRRIFHVLRFLTTTDMPLKEIAYRTGFCSAEYMSKIFRLYCGMTPGEYRRLNSDGDGK